MHVNANGQMVLGYQLEISTPRCSQEVSAADLPWLQHFRVQCYMWAKALLRSFRKTKFTSCYLATRPEVEAF